MIESKVSVQREYEFKKTAGSTSTLLKTAVKESAVPLYRVLCAERQTAGRGRMGRTFVSPPGGIYFSAAFPFERMQPHLSFFTLLSGLTVCKTLEPVAPLTIKWPNDIMLNGRKVCGMLAETVFAGDRPTVILGVGINASLPADEIPPELKEKMTSFTAEGLPAPPVKETVKRIVVALDAELYGKNALSGDLSQYLKEIEARNFLSGRRVSRTLEKGAVSGVVLGLSPTGGLLVKTDAGETTEITFGEIN